MKMKYLLVAVMGAVACVKQSKSETKDYFVEDPVKQDHQVIYVEKGNVVRQFCSNKNPTTILNRSSCQPNLEKKSTELDYEARYKPLLRTFLGLPKEPVDLKAEETYLTGAIERLEGKRIALQVGGAGSQQDLKVLETEISATRRKLETQRGAATAEGRFTRMIALLEGTSKSGLPNSSESLALLAPFDRPNDVETVVDPSSNFHADSEYQKELGGLAGDIPYDFLSTGGVFRFRIKSTFAIGRSKEMLVIVRDNVRCEFTELGDTYSVKVGDFVEFDQLSASKSSFPGKALKNGRTFIGGPVMTCYDPKVKGHLFTLGEIANALSEFGSIEWRRQL